MATVKMPIDVFVRELEAAQSRGDGYIMGATGQDPRQWAANSWWFTQYSGTQRAQALHWRESAARVWDCNGLAEGLYKDYTGVDINTKARYNYADWCGVKGAGLIPAAYRVPGAAVFWGDSAASIAHVAYLIRPVDAGAPEGDWHIIEARGVMYGVVMSRLYARKPNFWGWMTRYFDYDGGASSAERLLRKGCAGEDVKAMQEGLIRLGYDCGRWGADGDFGAATELAVRRFQEDLRLEVDGLFGPESRAALEAALSALEKRAEDPRCVRIVGGSCYVRTAPNTGGAVLGVAREGTLLPFGGAIDAETQWLSVVYRDAAGWVSCKYGRLEGASSEVSA